METRKFQIFFERCPFCGGENSCQLFGMIHVIPYFGETIESVISCSRCGFKHADVMHTEEREPRRYEYTVESDEDMRTRVIRSSTGVVEIPELGVSITPGSRSEGFVSNVEGVLERIRQAIERAMIGGEEEGIRKRAEEKLEFLERLKTGRARCTLVVWDPRGQSAVVHPKARSRPLTEEELNKT